MTFGAAIAAIVVAAIVPLACTMNRRRPVSTLELPTDGLVVRAVRHVVPRADQCLELREGRVHLPGHGSLLGFAADDFGRELSELAQHRNGELEHFDLALELRL